MKVLSIQDISCYGQCSLTVALPIISSFNIELAILPSAILSNHTGGFSEYTFLDLTDNMKTIVDSWERQKIQFDAIYTGYIGNQKQFEYIKECNDNLNHGPLIVDPAFADHGVIYKGLSLDIVQGMRTLIKEADIIMPNLTEASFLLNREYKEAYSKKEIKEMLYLLSLEGPKNVIITGYQEYKDTIGCIAYNSEKKEYYEFQTPIVDKAYHGTGDIFASAFVGSYLKDSKLKKALRIATKFTYEAILNTIGDKKHSYGVHFEDVLSNKIKSK